NLYVDASAQEQSSSNASGDDRGLVSNNGVDSRATTTNTVSASIDDSTDATVENNVRVRALYDSNTSGNRIDSTGARATATASGAGLVANAKTEADAEDDGTVSAELGSSVDIDAGGSVALASYGITAADASSSGYTPSGAVGLGAAIASAVGTLDNTVST